MPYLQEVRVDSAAKSSVLCVSVTPPWSLSLSLSNSSRIIFIVW
jgi:hypothetical protein